MSVNQDEEAHSNSNTLGRFWRDYNYKKGISLGEKLQHTYQYLYEDLAENATTAALDLYPKMELFELKQEENDKRRQSVSKVCAGINSVVKELMEYNIEDVILSEKNMIAYCSVQKIASTTWTHFFLRTGPS